MHSAFNERVIEMPVFDRFVLSINHPEDISAVIKDKSGRWAKIKRPDNALNAWLGASAGHLCT